MAGWYIGIDKDSNADYFELHEVFAKKLDHDSPCMMFSFNKEVVLIECYVPKNMSFSATEWLEYVAMKPIEPIKIDDECITIEMVTEYPEKEVEAKKSIAVQYLILQGAIEEESDDEFVYDEW